MASHPCATLARRLAQATHTRASEWIILERAREGMQLAFSALSGGSVVTQAFTCLTAVTPIVASGLHPIYADISPRTYAIDPRRLTIPHQAAAIVYQHTFGILDTQAARSVFDHARSRGLLCIEDSAHCLARMARDEDGHPLADLSVHSFGAEKMTATHAGGAIWVNPRTTHAQWRHELFSAASRLAPPRLRDRFAMRSYHFQRRAYAHTGALGEHLKRLAGHAEIWSPPVAPIEASGIVPTPRQPSPFVAHAAADELKRLRDNYALRSSVAKIYDSFFGPVSNSQPLCRYPIEVSADPEVLLREMWERGYYVGRWYRPLLFPGVDSPDFALDTRAIPVSTRLSARVINLPMQISPDGARELASQLAPYQAG